MRGTLQKEAKTRIHIRFPIYISGKYTSLFTNNHNPIYNNKLSQPMFKYTKQRRFCIGVAAVWLEDGVVEGRHSKAYDYTGQQLVCVKVYNKFIKKINE